jgi:hypothetical protein
MRTKINHKSEQELIFEGLRKHGRSAYNATLSKGIAVTVLKGNKICKIDPDGKVSIIARIDKPVVKVTRRSFKVK